MFFILKNFIILLIFIFTSVTCYTTLANGNNTCDLNFLDKANFNIINETHINLYRETLKQCVALIRNTEVPDVLQFESCDEVYCALVCGMDEQSIVSVICNVFD